MTDEQRIRELLEALGISSDLLEADSPHSIEAAELKKAWIKHMFSSLSKLNTAVENLTKDVHIYSQDLLKQTSETKLELNKIQGGFKEALSEFREDLRVREIKPLQDRVTTLMIKVATIGILGGLLGSGIIGAVALVFRELLKKHLL